ncbi:ATP-binding protein [Infirmifilum lucidum]|uniref:ATP-binding protein n=1 Tax=Infirmifilum lucidum TaxID=2776706 RepID=A0A7L9FH83_9CREN|nr:ATP-binding protein [Infirmifilum lucidum]QOJ79001.1 ATP-binding protein [Infirmifilum lucidum]
MGLLSEVTREYIGSLQFVKAVEREARIPTHITDIVAVVGARRVGKTFLMLQKARELLERGENVIYVSMDEPFFRRMEARKLAELAKSEYPEGRIHLFLDEVQEWRNWDFNLRWLHDVKDFYIYVSGSSSTLQSSEIPSRLRGRYVSVVLLPFSFREAAGPLGAGGFRDRGTARGLLEDYLKWGGFPEVWLARSREKLVSIVETVFYRDIVERQGVRSVGEFKEVFYYVLSQYGNAVTWRSLRRLLEGEGLKLDTKTLIRYVYSMQQAFLLFQVKKFSFSERERAVSPRKIYLVDHSIATLFEQPMDLGRRVENVVYTHLLRRTGDPERISYYTTRRGREVDFIVREPGGATRIYESTLRATREHVDKAEQACRELKCSHATVVALEAEELEGLPERVSVVPLLEFLLRG